MRVASQYRTGSTSKCRVRTGCIVEREMTVWRFGWSSRVCWENGERRISSVEFAHRSLATLEAAGATVLYRESPLPHAIEPGFVAELRPWLRGVLAAL